MKYLKEVLVLKQNLVIIYQVLNTALIGSWYSAVLHWHDVDNDDDDDDEKRRGKGEVWHGKVGLGGENKQ